MRLISLLPRQVATPCTLAWNLPGLLMGRFSLQVPVTMDVADSYECVFCGRDLSTTSFAGRVSAVV
jgi:hypothetical protein